MADGFKYVVDESDFSIPHNVLWYGARNDGSSFDNIGAINAAIDAASAAGGGVVYLPAGTYEIWPNVIKNWIKLNTTAAVSHET
jgi:polygalacturonase